MTNQDLRLRRAARAALRTMRDQERTETQPAPETVEEAPSRFKGLMLIGMCIGGWLVVGGIVWLIAKAFGS